MDKPFTDMRDLVRGFADAMNLISPEVQYHHQQVAYLSYRIAIQMNLPREIQKNIVYGALMHDVGIILMKQCESLRQAEMSPLSLARKSGELLQLLPQTKKLSSIVSCCQNSYGSLLKPLSGLIGMLDSGQIIHLADFVSLSLRQDVSILNQPESIVASVQERKNEFSPRVVDAFVEVSKMESVWMDLVMRPDAFLDFLPEYNPVSLDETQKLTEIMSLIIDFRSPFTAMHSAGVSASATELARLIGMSESEQKMMQIAGNLHDLGKLKIPTEILEKPGKLTREEFNIIKEHAYYTTLYLGRVRGFEQITTFAGYHHEKLSGQGYPFRLTAEEIPLGSRIMSCADIFSAITEERPYRKGMEKDQVVRIMKENVEQGALAPVVVECLLDNYSAIDAERDHQSHIAGRRYFDSLENNSSQELLPD